MPKASRTGSDKLSALIAEIGAEAYARGQADARKELLDVLGAGAVRAPRAKASRGRKARTAAAPKRRARGGKRAPRGSVPRFVEQALRETPGLTPPEILARAATDMERPDQAAVDPDRAEKRPRAGQVRSHRRMLVPCGVRPERRGNGRDGFTGGGAGFGVRAMERARARPV